MKTTMERESDRLQLQDRLDAEKSQAERNRLGQFATPPLLANHVVEYASALLSGRSKVRFFDPGFGTGSFYSALLKTIPRSRIEAASAFEIDPHYGEDAKRIWSGTKLRLRLEDFTKATPPQSENSKFNFVICNPPYVRHHHMSHEQKSHLRSSVSRFTGIEMNGLSGLYTYFMVLSQAWMTKGGVAAWLIPSEFMDVNYGRKVKTFLLDKVTLLRIHRFDPTEVQFGDAMVSSAVVYFKNSPHPDNHEVEFSFGGTISKPTLVDRMSVTELRHIPKWTGFPGSRSAPKSDDTLASLFKIKRGLATGCNSFFIVTPQTVEEQSLPSKFLQPILPSPRFLRTEEIPTTPAGIPKIEKRLFLLSCNLPESDVQEQYPSLWKYLQRGIEEGVQDRYLCRHREPWYSQEDRPPPPFLCTYMGRPTKKSEAPFRFILNWSKGTATNLYLLLYPKPALAEVLEGDKGLRRAVWKALGNITAEMLIGEGRVYGGGLHKIEPKELGNVSSDVVLKSIPKVRRRQRQQSLFRN